MGSGGKAAQLLISARERGNEIKVLVYEREEKLLEEITRRKDNRKVRDYPFAKIELTINLSFFTLNLLNFFSQ